MRTYDHYYYNKEKKVIEKYYPTDSKKGQLSFEEIREIYKQKENKLKEEIYHDTKTK